MKISCGGLIYCNNKLLIVRPRWDSDKWNLPKGELHDNEDHYECAKREILEETNIDVSKCAYRDLGVQKYLKGKKLHLYTFILKELPSNIECKSFFLENGKETPEVVDFKWIEPNEMNKYFSDNLLESVVYSIRSHLFDVLTFVD